MVKFINDFYKWNGAILSVNDVEYH